MANRDGHASYLWDAPAEYARNEHILRWWGPTQDDAVRATIEQFAWNYPWEVSDAVVQVTENDVLEAWRTTDPLCKSFAWYNVLLYFAVARARAVGLEDTMRVPTTLRCLRCSTPFRQDSLRPWAVKRLGASDDLDYCLECCEQCLLEHDLNDIGLSDADIAAWMTELALHIGAVPPANLFDQPSCLAVVSGKPARTRLMELGARRPTAKRVNDSFNSWLNALVASGVLPDGTHRTAKGVRSIASDGHECLSIAERTIDDWLTAYGIEHYKEPRYPDSNYRGDFRVGDTIIEFFGLAGDDAYDARILEKRALAERHDIDLVEVYPKDMIAWGMTQVWLGERLGFDPATRERHPLLAREPAALSDDKPEAPQPAPIGPEAGWYADPTGRERWRWWDGRFWSYRVRDPQGAIYSDTPYPGRHDGTNRGSEVDGEPTWEIVSATQRQDPTACDEDERRAFVQLMFRCMDAVENEAQAEGVGVAPSPYAQASGLFQRIRAHGAELAILERFAAQPHAAGAQPPELMARLKELREVGLHGDPIAAELTGGYPSPSSKA
jgi:hypothetical protein